MYVNRSAKMKRKRHWNIQRETLPDVPDSGDTHAYEGMIYRNPLCDTLPDPPTDDELQACLSYEATSTR